MGEGLQTVPILERLRQRRPDVQICYTFFSPSAERFAAARGADVHGFLPFDTAASAETLLAALRPSALVFSKLDVWPRLAETAAARGTSVGLISATLSPTSARRGVIARSVLRDAYASLAGVGAISALDAERLEAIGVRASAVSVTGDTRYDQVWGRATTVDRASPLLGPLRSDRPTLVAGSTWPSDDAVLFPAWELVRRAVPTARLIIAPHEPTTEHCAPIEAWARSAGCSCARLGTPAAASADVLLVDRVGVLGELYALASSAFVGGGFHRAGLHSVLEPAAFGAPVVCGPLDASQRDAGLLAEMGGLVRVTDATSLSSALVAWLGDSARRRRDGLAAKQVVSQGLGAADRSYALVERLLGVSYLRDDA